VTVPDNLLDWLDARISLAGATDELSVALPKLPTGGRDATLIIRDPAWGASDAASQALESIVATDECRVVGRKRDRVHIRLADHLLEEVAAELERKPEDPFRTRQLASGQAWVVNFIDPNTTKALHIGHLRNIAVGQSLASLAEASGISVTRQIRVGDYGRNMGEAMAGYLAYGDGRTPRSTGLPGDRLVGACYARYVASLAPQPDATPADAALTREGHVAQDAAERLLERWREGDEEARRLFSDVRQWVLDGHAATYDRLGVTVDRTVFESEHLDHASAMIERGLEAGLFRRTADGAIVYDTGDPEYERFLLVRPDGFPTQHLRYIATWSATRRLYDEAHSVNVQGSEWRHMGKYNERILREMIQIPDERHPATDIIYEMVVSKSGVIKSSKGDALLVDDILDEIIASAPMNELQRRHERVVPDELAPLVALSYFITRPVGQRMMIEPGAFTDPAGPGWQLARAWAEAWHPAFDGCPAPAVDEADYRFLVVHSSLHRRLLARCVAQKQVLPLVRLHVRLASWFTTTTPTAPLARAMRSLLGEGLVALGLHPTGAPCAADAHAEVVVGGRA
jgi:arginyl-tRNA synthetase